MALLETSSYKVTDGALVILVKDSQYGEHQRVGNWS